MDINTAKEIANLACRPERRLIDAIRLLRNETGLGLLQSKDYLETTKDETTLFNVLCKDYVTNKRDLLAQAKEELRQLEIRISILEFEIEEEDVRQEQLDTLFAATNKYEDG